MKRKAKKRYFKRSFQESIDYLKESRKSIYFIIGVFFISALITFVLPSYFTFFDEIIGEIFLKTSHLDGLELTIYIFINNFTAALVSLLLGLFLGIFPVINAVTNGGLLGYVSARVVDTVGILTLWRLLPHGIFEIPAILIAMGLGVKLGMTFFSGNIKKNFSYRLDRSIKALVFVILPLLLIAAIIEGILISFL